MGRVFFVRHGSHAELGHVLSGRSDIALDAAGRQQAAALPAGFASLDAASLHSSPRRRAIETAKPLAAARGLDIRITPALDEVDFGAFAGRRFDDLDGDPEWMRWNAQRGETRCPQGETMAEAMERALAYAATLPAEDYPAICVTHCDVIRAIVAHVLGLGVDRLFLFGCDPASRTTIDITPYGLRLVALNVPA